MFNNLPDELQSKIHDWGVNLAINDITANEHNQRTRNGLIVRYTRLRDEQRMQGRDRIADQYQQRVHDQEQQLQQLQNESHRINERGNFHHQQFLRAERRIDMQNLINTLEQITMV